MVLILVVGGAALAWKLLGSSHTAATDNAYVHGNIVAVTSQVNGTVVSIEVDETDRVEAGQALVKLDTTDSRNQLRNRGARLARVIRETRAMYPEVERLRATITMRESAMQRARNDLVNATDRLRRRESLGASGVVPEEQLQEALREYENAKSELAAAESAVRAAREELDSQLALTAGVSAKSHPSIEEAASEFREAWLAVKRSEIRAPISGHVARRTVQVGQRVDAGANLLSIVNLEGVWVEANFKESQVRNIRIGQPATLIADAYGDSVVFHGHVIGLGIGTGSAFALLPPQNATGNWIKILQRLPVRIALDPGELAKSPLRVGMSMRALVDTADSSGSMLSATPPSSPAVQTAIFDQLETQADDTVRQVIEAHFRAEMGASPTKQPRRAAATR